MQYIKRVNKIEAIQNRGDVLNNVIPFLNERGIPYQYTSNSLQEESISITISRDDYNNEKYTSLHLGEYLVISEDGISIIGAEEFAPKYQLADEVFNVGLQKEIDELKSKVELLQKAHSDNFDGYSAKKTLAKSYENSN